MFDLTSDLGSIEGLTTGEAHALLMRYSKEDMIVGLAILEAERRRLSAEVVRLGRELTARGRRDLVDKDAEDPMDVYDRQMETDFNSLDDDGALDDLANDYRGVDDTAQGRGEQP